MNIVQNIFFSKEIAQAETKHLTCLQLKNGESITCSKIILEKQREYYENLYGDRSEDIHKIQAETDKFNNMPNIPCLNAEEKTD